MLRINRRGWSVGVTPLLLGAALAPSWGAPGVVVDAKRVRHATVLMIGGRAMVPVRGVVERIRGARVHWDAAHKRIIVWRGKQRVRLHLYSGYAQLNGQAVPLDVPVVLRDRKALLPLRSVAELLGAEVRYESGLVRIASGRPGIAVAGYRQSNWAARFEKPGQVAFGGVELVRLETEGEFGSLDERVSAVTDRLTDSIPAATHQGRFQHWRVYLSSASGDPVICIGNRAVLRVTDRDAEKRGVSKKQLAGEWLRQIRAGLRRVYGAR